MVQPVISSGTPNRVFVISGGFVCKHQSFSPSSPPLRHRPSDLRVQQLLVTGGCSFNIMKAAGESFLFVLLNHTVAAWITGFFFFFCHLKAYFGYLPKSKSHLMAKLTPPKCCELQLWYLGPCQLKYLHQLNSGFDPATALCCKKSPSQLLLIFHLAGCTNCYSSGLLQEKFSPAKRQVLKLEIEFLHHEVVFKVVMELSLLRNIIISSCMSPVMPEPRLKRWLQLNDNWSSQKKKKQEKRRESSRPSFLALLLLNHHVCLFFWTQMQTMTVLS